MCDYSTEQWRDVIGYEGHYQVSDQGRVRSLKKGKQRIRALAFTPNFYPTLCLCKDGKCKTFPVHILVLTAFVGPCPPGMECRHFPDNDRWNCKLDNLMWGTRKENAHDRIYQGTTGRGLVRPDLSGTRHYKAVLNDDKVRQLRKMWKTGAYTRSQLAKAFGVTTSTARAVVIGLTWKHILEEAS